MSKKAVGIYGREVYISENGNVEQFSVIRPVSQELLEELHDVEYWKKNYRYWWVDAAKEGRTDDSLEDFFQKMIDEEDNGDDVYIGKDNSDCEVLELDDELRAKCDRFILETTGMEVGTWEAAGCYSPMKWGEATIVDRFIRFDLVLDEELARKYYELRNLGEI